MMMIRISALVIALLAAACGGDGVCTSTAVGTGGVSSDLNFRQCWDQQDRNVSCTAPPGANEPITCTCSVAGTVGNRFVRNQPLLMSASPTEAELAPINTACGWSLRPR